MGLEVLALPSICLFRAVVSENLFAESVNSTARMSQWQSFFLLENKAFASSLLGGQRLSLQWPVEEGMQLNGA
ncbi:hypothetical protein PWG14_26500 [Chromobacterium amazonense]|uniref:hypothetical protein n=1 Tax=Chromobacterium amazonense TaxID=1382803 RepID=UPI00237DE9F9|nr:hypothetical protein [Chromobacterium amazonense]MDE1716020.1 hypothetical protein [Chromobacterium amazonense]